MRIGVDFDNTIASYDATFRSVASEWGVLPVDFIGGKHQVREAIRTLPDGETAWMRLQGRVYGHYMPRAEPMPGVREFLIRAKAAGAELMVVSHKTQFGHFDPDRVDLRQAALTWLEANGFLELIPRRNVFFETTRAEKVARIAALEMDAFVDDLEEVFREPGFPGDVEACLFAAGLDHLPEGPFRAFADFPELADHLLLPLEAAKYLAGGTITGLRRGATGGNNRLYRVETSHGSLALKAYPVTAGDERDRLGTEFSALTFLHRHGVTQIPRALAADRSHAFALYSWEEGTTVPLPESHDIDSVLSFAARLHQLRGTDGAGDVPLASEACLSGAELVRQIERRHHRLSMVAVEHPDLADFLDRCVPLIAGFATAARQELDMEADLPAVHRTLSPSDFGFHNTLRRPDGSLVFVDFEYFGWDDPVKLVADFTLHPGMNLTPPLKQRFLAGAQDLYGGDAGFADRFRLLLPLYALRWCMIILNEFLPERWIRRAAAGTGDRATVRARQLTKAQTLLSDTLKAHP